MLVGTCGNICAPGFECCGSSCINVLSNSSNCGTCSRSCSGSTPDCCNGFCTNKQNDFFNCGSCNNACAAGQQCCSGTCTTVLTNNTTCGTCGGPTCSGSTPNCCGGACTNTQTDFSNCGGCGTSCQVGQHCCSGNCVSFATTVNNCGGCGNVWYVYMYLRYVAAHSLMCCPLTCCVQYWDKAGLLFVDVCGLIHQQCQLRYMRKQLRFRYMLWFKLCQYQHRSRYHACTRFFYGLL